MTSELNEADARIRQMVALRDLVVQISKIRDLDDLFWHVARHVPRLLEAEDCAVLLVEPESSVLTFRTAKTRNVGVTIPKDSVSILMSVFKEKRPRRVEDASKEPDFNIEIARKAGLQPRSLLAVPVILQSEAIGVIEVINKHKGFFNQEDEELLLTIAFHVAASVENGWLHGASRRRLNELSILVEISRAISTSYDNDTLFANISKALNETTNLDEFSISWWDTENGKLVRLMDSIHFAEIGLNEPRPSECLLDDYPLLSEVLENRTVKILTASGSAPQYADQENGRNKSLPYLMVIPMVVRNNATGLIEIYFSEDKAGGDTHIHLYQSIANQIGAALENTRLHEESRRQANILEQRVQDRTKELEMLYTQQTDLAESERIQRKLVETLREAGSIVASTLDPASAIREILNQLARVVPHDSASVQLLNENELVIVAGGGWLEYENMQGYKFPIPGDNPNTLVLHRRQPVILNHKDLIKFEEFQKATHGAIQSWLGVPLITQDMIIGMLTLDSTKNNYFSQEHANLASAFADQVAVALEQAILFQKTQSALQERDALRTIMVEISEELELSALLQTIMIKSCELLDTVSAEIGLFNPEEDCVEIAAIYNQADEFIGKKIPMGAGLLGQAALSRKPILLSNYSSWEHALPDFKDSIWFASMGVPLIYRQRLIGAIAVGDTRETKTFTNSDLSLLAMLAHQATIAIENAQLFQKVQQLATTDELTGLPNRRELFRVGEELFKVSKAEEFPLTAVMIDIDLFKQINDTYGHSIGDQVLKELAAICSARIRDNDILCRYGGEEFTLILPGTDLSTGEIIADRLRRAIENTPVETDRGRLNVTASFGVTALGPEHRSLANLVDAADAAMYRAKNLGRNRVETINGSGFTLPAIHS